MKEKNKIDLNEIKTFIAEVEKSKKYNSEEISKYHDLIFGENDYSSSNSSCSIMRMRKIKAWYQDQKK